MSYLRWIELCNRAELSAYRPWTIAGEHVGWMPRAFADALPDDNPAFAPAPADAEGPLRLHPGLETPAARTAALAALLHPMAKDGRIKALYGEHYRIATSISAPPLASVDRAAAALLGIRSWGVHVNGYVRKPDGPWVWVGRRADDRLVAPGELDNFVAGGQPADATVTDNLIKEAGEEADVPPHLARRAQPVGHVSYCGTNAEGHMRADTLLLYDLDLPADFVPRNTDGEVAGFELWPVPALAARVLQTDDFKWNCNLVVIDFLVRHGHLDADNCPDYEKIVMDLRRPFPTIGG